MLHPCTRCLFGFLTFGVRACFLFFRLVLLALLSCQTLCREYEESNLPKKCFHIPCSRSRSALSLRAIASFLRRSWAATCSSRDRRIRSLYSSGDSLFACGRRKSESNSGKEARGEREESTHVSYTENHPLCDSSSVQTKTSRSINKTIVVTVEKNI
jgi:hypothetical protein